MYLKSWDDFEKGAERLYLQDPLKCRYNILYIHKKGIFKVKMTNDVVCLQYKSESIQECKRMEKFISNLLRHMASNKPQA
ncbi:signal recognition particle 9 kDa protein [Folsomia candida]|uniref:signal recognition particle 9 kDa protein n=1 Tax=Folsomia candida TaxID=158441 RepID=UPI000B8F8439|nr:signal recognition particle 9 kDa protein [Folsomia candida]